MKPVKFKKKIFPFGDSYGVIIEKLFLRELGIEKEDLKNTWVQVQVERIDDKKERKKIVNKALQIAAEDTGSSYVKIEYEKEKKNETK